jgi:membrane-associated phospholipid phosphatase
VVGILAGWPERPSGDKRFWPVDKIILAYAACTTAVILGWWSRLPSAATLFAIHVAAIALLLFEVKRPNRFTKLFRHWYPLLYVASCYREMSMLIPAIRSWSGDEALARIDLGIWGAHPTVWLERVHSPALTEFLQLAYTLFVPAVLLVSYLLWRQGELGKFQYYGFLIALGFLASYVGYVLVPARGPRFLLNHLQSFQLRGLWLFGAMQNTLDQLESAHYDCFPSGHTELTILACWGSQLVGRRWFKCYFLYTPALIFATVYLRYHYTVDVLAGGVLAATLILLTPRLYKYLS